MNFSEITKKQEITKKHIVMLSLNNCINCEKLKGYFISKNIIFENISCNEYLNDDTFEKTLFSLTSKNTNVFPIVFLNGVYMGGYNEILEYYNDC
jgi:glutaredoxin